MTKNLARFARRRPAQLLATTALLTVGWCAPASGQSPTEVQPNILVIIGDDMGVETLGSFEVGTHTPTTVTLDELAQQGVSFSTMWSQAMCSPTRATMLTGRYGFRTGVGGPTGDNEQRGPMPEAPSVPANVIEQTRGGMGGGMGGGRGPGGLAQGGRWGITLDEVTLPQALGSGRDYATAAIGKWHLSDIRNGWADHPNLAGFEHFSGLVRCCPESYFAWVKLVNGEFSSKTGYAVTDKVDDAIDWLDRQHDNDDPWFLWLAFNTPHSPLHMPPRDLLQSDYSALSDEDLRADPSTLFKAMIEAMDTEIGRLLANIDEETLENTYVIFIGDNGTGGNVIGEPFRRNGAKGTLYNGGINVPFIVTGPGVARGATADALVNSTDVFATVLEMAGVDMQDTVPDDVMLDSISLMPYLSDPDRASIRDWIYADAFTTDLGLHSGSYTMRNARYKLLVNEGVEHFFDLQADPYERNDLLTGELTAEQRGELTKLRRQIESLHTSEP